MATEDILRELETRMKKTLDVVSKELAGIRTGRASPSLVENVVVDYHGVPTPLKQMATISAPEARLILVQPWDKTAVGMVDKGIRKADLGFNPTSDGNVLRIAIPPLSEERRTEMTKLVKKRVEEGKIALRNIRRDGVEHLRVMEKEKKISQDEEKRGLDKLQKLTDAFILQAEKAGQAKEAELMKV